MLVISQFTRPDSVFLVHLDGELDLFGALRLRRVLQDVVDAGASALAIDVAHLSFVDGSALGLLERVWAELRGLGVLIDVVNASERFRWLVGLTGLQDTFQLSLAS